MRMPPPVRTGGRAAADGGAQTAISASVSTCSPVRVKRAPVDLVEATLTRPVRERRAGDNDRTEQVGCDGGEHHHRPAGLAIADNVGLAIRIGVQLDNLW